jgi:hypothetical protein
VLLWPFPFVFIGIALANIVRRFPRFGKPAVLALACCLVAGNLLTTNRYLADLITNGGEGGWTDAIYPLAAEVNGIHPLWFGLVDWGCLNELRMLHTREMGFFELDEAAMSQPLDATGLLFIQHVRDKQILPGVNDKFGAAVHRQGLTEKLIEVIPDKEGRPVFELLTLGDFQ